MLELARAAVTALRAHVDADGEPKRSYEIDTQLAVRQSTGYPKGALRNLRKRERNIKQNAGGNALQTSAVSLDYAAATSILRLQA